MQHSEQRKQFSYGAAGVVLEVVSWFQATQASARRRKRRSLLPTSPPFGAPPLPLFVRDPNIQARVAGFVPHLLSVLSGD